MNGRISLGNVFEMPLKVRAKHDWRTGDKQRQQHLQQPGKERTTLPAIYLLFKPSNTLRLVVSIMLCGVVRSEVNKSVKAAEVTSTGSRVAGA